jgi:hypothetical protein
MTFFPPKPEDYQRIKEENEKVREENEDIKVLRTMVDIWQD